MTKREQAADIWRGLPKELKLDVEVWYGWDGAEDDFECWDVEAQKTRVIQLSEAKHNFWVHERGCLPARLGTTATQAEAIMFSYQMGTHSIL